MRDERGFSLVEILVAFLILTVIITVSMATFIERNNRLRQANELVLVYQALANEAEYRRRIDYGSLEDAEKAFLSDTTVLAPLGPHATTVQVALLKPGAKTVTMIVRWKEGKREAKLALVRVDTGGTNLW